MVDWVISNKKLKHLESELLNGFEGLYINTGNVLTQLKERDLHYEGFQLPRLDHVGSAKELTEIKFEDFENHIKNRLKGNFTIIRSNRKSLEIYNDHVGIHKFFWYQNEDSFIISNNIWLILREIEPVINDEAMVDHVLFNRFVDGKTLWKYVSFSGPAMKLSVTENSLIYNQYWQYSELTKEPVSEVGFDEIAQTFNDLTNSYINNLNPDKISVPMTGGFDCRSVIASLMHDEITPVSYTYGHSESADSVYGRLAAKKMGLDFKVHYLGDDEDKYRSLRKEIVHTGNSLASSHRAHRLYGIEKESQRAGLMLLGYLGGEVIRGLWPDDLIISKPIRELWEGNKEVEEIVTDAFQMAGFISKPDLLVYGIEKLKEFKLDTHEESYLKVLFEIKAHLHYAQDLNLFSHKLTPVAFYLDLDYLQMIFSSQHNFLFKESMTQNKLKKLDSPLFNSNLINRLYPKLAKVQLGKGFSPEEFLKRRWYVYFKKGIRHYLKKPKYQPNYNYGAWYVEMVKSDLSDIRLTDYFATERIKIPNETATEKEIQHLTRIWDLNSFVEKAKGINE